MNWDIFISHASEDKDVFVREFVRELQKAGWKVWYDEFSLTAGDSLREAIDRGISQSRVGVVVFSPNFFRKHWTAVELNGIFTIAANQGKTLVPIWLGVTASDVTQYSPMIADKVALKAEEGIFEVARKLEEILARDALRSLNRDVFVYDVNVAGKNVQMVSPISGDWLFKHGYGLPTEAVFGLLIRSVKEGGLFLPHKFRENLRFVKFLHQIIAQHVYEDSNLYEEAARQGQGFIYLIDKRTPDLNGHIPPEDIFGYIRVESGHPIPESYEANYKHLLLTENGFFKLPSEDFENALIHKIRKQCAEGGGPQENPEVELRDKI